jgi:hypothetical protein
VPYPGTHSCRVPELGNEPPPVIRTFADFYAQEIDGDLQRDRLCLGAEEIPNPGDYKVKRLEFARTSVIWSAARTVESARSTCVPAPRQQGDHRDRGEETYGSKKAAILTCRPRLGLQRAGRVLHEKNSPPRFKRSENGLRTYPLRHVVGFRIHQPRRAAGNPGRIPCGAKDHPDGYPFENRHTRTATRTSTASGRSA